MIFVDSTKLCLQDFFKIIRAKVNFTMFHYTKDEKVNLWALCVHFKDNKFEARFILEIFFGRKTRTPQSTQYEGGYKTLVTKEMKVWEVHNSNHRVKIILENGLSTQARSCGVPVSLLLFKWRMWTMLTTQLILSL